MGFAFAARREAADEVIKRQLPASILPLFFHYYHYSTFFFSYCRSVMTFFDRIRKYFTAKKKAASCWRAESGMNAGNAVFVIFAFFCSSKTNTRKSVLFKQTRYNIFFNYSYFDLTWSSLKKVCSPNEKTESTRKKSGSHIFLSPPRGRTRRRKLFFSLR